MLKGFFGQDSYKYKSVIRKDRIYNLQMHACLGILFN